MNETTHAELESRREANASKLQPYEGYEDREARRRCDESLRAHLLAGIRETLGRLMSLDVYLERKAAQVPRSRVQELGHRLELLQDKMQLAPYGASPFFLVDRLEESVQLRLLEEDEALIEAHEALGRTIAPTLGPETPLATQLDGLEAALATLEQRIDQRMNAIAEYAL